MQQPRPYKIPHSVLVVIHTPSLQVLLVNRADMPDYWQSVTGSKDTIDEPLETTARREVMEETGIDCAIGRLSDWNLENVYDIYPRWLHRYEPGVRRNTEHVFGLCVPENTPVTLNPREHTAYQWLPWRDAADTCASFSNAEAILLLPEFADGNAL
ncbi:dihydroneopterin triphosphate diphosphatase [Ramlibacter sp. PS4R-6]|uniref:dihydroneopterin triphosphate diphosphatase n=1 Tax=Ramlibacter sp. PS4R-6 TaxID=3133438 RepID=UPI0030B457EF